MDTERMLGQKIDQYRIKRHLARGGMADVYLAIDEDLGRFVAFKVMLDTLAQEPNYVRRFQREARTVARLDHPNIVKIYSTGKTPLGQPYIAMQYIEGGSLRDTLIELAERNKLLTTEQILNIMRQLAAALAVAHQAGIVHRDLKPGNVLIRPDSTPVLVDLGIAAVESGAKLTQTGGFMGTPAYMSPEQLWGSKIDGRSDLYALGLILYEMFAGNHPFHADDMTAIMYKQIHENPVPLRELRPDLSPQTVAIVETLLKKEPLKRFQTAENLVDAIDLALRTAGGHGPNPQATEVLTRLDDSILLSRGGVVQFSPPAAKDQPAAARLFSAKSLPIWIFGFLGICLLGAVAIVFLALVFRPGAAEPTTVVERPTRLVTATSQPIQEAVDLDPTGPPAPETAPTNTALPTSISTVPPPPTPTPSNTPTITLTPVCAGALPTRLTIDGRAVVVNFQLNVRTGPGTQFSLVNRMQVGREVTVMDGPRCGDGQLWYYIVADVFVNSQGEEVRTEGWAVEESDGVYYLEPIE